MPQEVVCPHCGQSVPLDAEPPPDSLDELGPPNVAHTMETVIPGTVCLDEMESPYRSISSRRAANQQPSDEETESAIPGYFKPKGPTIDPEAGSSEFDRIVAGAPDPILDAMAAGELALASETEGYRDGANGALKQVAETGSVGSVDPDLDGAGTTNWIMVLLSSYASAATLGLIYLLWNGHGHRPSAAPTLPADSRSDPVKREVALSKLADDRMSALGTPLTIGSLEITPLEVKASPVELQHLGDGAVNSALGGAETLCVRLKLKNLSATATFRPLEPSFVRNPDRGFCDTLIETESGLIETFPLAISSEQTIVGQSFEPLKPGETRETLVACDPDGLSRKSTTMTWRIKLRVDENRVDVVGVRFTSDQVK